MRTPTRPGKISGSSVTWPERNCLLWATTLFPTMVPISARQHVRGKVGMVIAARHADQAGYRVGRICHPGFIVVIGEDQSQSECMGGMP